MLRLISGDVYAGDFIANSNAFTSGVEFNSVMMHPTSNPDIPVTSKAFLNENSVVAISPCDTVGMKLTGDDDVASDLIDSLTLGGVDEVAWTRISGHSDPRTLLNGPVPRHIYD